MVIISNEDDANINQGCRFRQMQNIEVIELQIARWLNETNVAVMEENNFLHQRIRSLRDQSEQLRHRLRLPYVADPRSDLQLAANGASLLLLAEAIKEEFLGRACGDLIGWAGGHSDGIANNSRNCYGLAARVWGMIPLHPIKLMEILKERASWSRGSRYLEAIAKYPASNGITIELVHMQGYGLSSLASAPDFWTIRCTSARSDGSQMVYEISLPGSVFDDINAPASPVKPNMLARGYLIHPCEGGGSTIQIVEHLYLEASSAPYVLLPLYESSEIVAQKLTVAALGHVERIAAKEMSGDGMTHTSLRAFCESLIKVFNDIVDTFTRDGRRSLIDCDGANNP